MRLTWFYCNLCTVVKQREERYEVLVNPLQSKGIELIIWIRFVSVSPSTLLLLRWLIINDGISRGGEVKGRGRWKGWQETMNENSQREDKKTRHMSRGKESQGKEWEVTINEQTKLQDSLTILHFREWRGRRQRQEAMTHDDKNFHFSNPYNIRLCYSRRNQDLYKLQSLLVQNKWMLVNGMNVKHFSLPILSFLWLWSKFLLISASSHNNFDTSLFLKQNNTTEMWVIVSFCLQLEISPKSVTLVIFNSRRILPWWTR